MANTTAGKIVKAALRRIGIPGTGQEPSAAEYADGIEDLNMLLSSLSAKGITIPARTKETFPLVIGTSEYSIGDGGDFDTTRPDRILGIFLRDSSGQDYYMDFFAINEYNDVWSKTSGGRPERMAFLPSYPLAKLFFDRTPGVAYTLHLDSDKPLTELASKTTKMVLPDPFKRMFVLRLAIDSASGFGETPSPSLVAEAVDATRIVENFVASAKDIPEVEHDMTLIARRQRGWRSGGGLGWYK